MFPIFKVSIGTYHFCDVGDLTYVQHQYHEILLSINPPITNLEGVPGGFKSIPNVQFARNPSFRS